MRWGVASALAGLLVAGCGSSHGGSGPAPATTKPADPATALTQYLDRLEVRDRRLDQLRATVRKSVTTIHVRTPDGTWDRAAARLGRVASELDRLSLEISALRSPPPLRRAHRDLAESVAVLEGYIYGVRNALQTHIPEVLAEAARADVTRMAALRGSWQSAVTAYARKLGVPLPDWLGGPALAA